MKYPEVRNGATISIGSPTTIITTIPVAGTNQIPGHKEMDWGKSGIEKKRIPR